MRLLMLIEWVKRKRETSRSTRAVKLNSIRSSLRVIPLRAKARSTVVVVRIEAIRSDKLTRLRVKLFT